MKKFFLLALSLAALSPLFSQTPAAPAPQGNQPQEVIVKIQQQQLPPPEAPKALPAKANEWVEVGTNIGTAIGSGLKSVAHETKDAVFGKDVTLVDGIDRVSKTDAGRFTMAVIAWKVAGNDLVHLFESNIERVKQLFVGVPIFTAWCVVSVWFWRRNFMPRKVCVERSGPFWNRTKKWQVIGDGPDWDHAAPWFCAIIPIIVAALLLGNIVF